MHRMMKALVRRRRGMAENGNGRNGNTSGFIQLAQLASTGVLILGMFGLWWGSANPSARLDKIETNQLDNRKELNDVISSLRKEISSNYTSLREHNEFQNRLKDNIEELHKADENFITKAQFEAWKNEREVLVKTELQRLDVLENLVRTTVSRPEHELVISRLDRIEADLKSLGEKTVGRAEHEQKWLSEYKVDEQVSHRIDGVLLQIEELRKSISVNPTDILTHRIDQLNESVRILQTQIFDSTHINNNKGNGK